MTSGLRKAAILTLTVGTFFGASAAKAPRLKADGSNIDKVIAAMTLPEKASLLVGTGMDGLTDADFIGVADKLVPGAAGTTRGIPRLGIPAVVLADGPAGVRISPTREGEKGTFYCTHFPIGTLLSSTWNTALISEVGDAIGNEALEYGCDVLLAPALNIHRHPLCGRNFEYYSEDPVLAGKIAAAYINGVQGNGVGTSIKHFAVNNQETNRLANNAVLSDRALREIYLKGFEIAIKESAPMTVMSSYNRINGTPASENTSLLSTVLRDEWGYKGMVMTDWGGGTDAAAQMVAGNDMLQPGKKTQIDRIIEGVTTGLIPQETLDRNVRRVLEMVLATPRAKGYVASNRPDLEKHAAVTRQSATEGMVLLKNDNAALPMRAGAGNVALFGRTSYDFIAGGTGSGNVNRAYTVSLLDGLKNAGLGISAPVADFYNGFLADCRKASAARKKTMLENFLGDPLPDEPVLDSLMIARAADTADMAVITLGRLSGECLDRSSADFNLSANERRLISDVCDIFHAKGKKAVVILNIGGVIETASWKDMPDAILCAWQGGQEGGNSVADILTGNANPSGKLPMTFPMKHTDHPSTLNFPVDLIDRDLFLLKNNIMGTGIIDTGIKDVGETRYAEDLMVGYRYFDTRDVKVSYPFGYGLSYTTFALSEPSVKVDGDTVEISVNVTNTGSVAGKEVVQIYVAAPETGADRPARELKAFAKTGMLAPGEKTTLTMTTDRYSLARFNEGANLWELPGGEYTFQIGTSLADLPHRLTATVAPATYPVLADFAK